MRWLATALCVGLLVAPAWAAPGDMAVYCQRISGGSYQTEAFCIDRENRAYSELSSRGPVEERILDYCNRISDAWSTLKFCIEREEAARGRLGNPPATLPAPTRWGLVNTMVRPTYIGGPGQRQTESVLGRYRSSQECEAARVQREASWLAAGGLRTGYGNTIAIRVPETGSTITSTLACVEGR